MTQEEFKELTEELLNTLEEFRQEVEATATFEHGHKSAAKRGRKLARTLKNELLQKWINASVDVTR